MPLGTGGAGTGEADWPLPLAIAWGVHDGTDCWGGITLGGEKSDTCVTGNDPPEVLGEKDGAGRVIISSDDAGLSWSCGWFDGLEFCCGSTKLFFIYLIINTNISLACKYNIAAELMQNVELS